MRHLLPTTHPWNGFAVGSRLIGGLAVLLSIVYLVSGITVVAPGEVALVKRLGRWVSRDGKVDVVQPGLIISWPAPIDRVVKLPIRQNLALEVDAFWQPPVEATPDNAADTKTDTEPLNADTETGRETGTETVAETGIVPDSAPPPRTRYAITGDHNAVEVRARVTYRIDDPVEYATRLENSALPIRHLVQRAITATVSAWSMPEVLSSQRLFSDWSSETVATLRSRYESEFQPDLWQTAAPQPVSELWLEDRLRQALNATSAPENVIQILADVRRSEPLSEAIRTLTRQRLLELGVGIQIVAIEIQAIQPPAEVHAAFLAVQDARIEQETWRQESLGEQAESLIEAETLAQQEIADARGKLESYLAAAHAEATLFRANFQTWQSELGPAALKRFQLDAWEQILAQKCRVFAVPRQMPVEGFQLTIPAPEGRR